MTILGFVSSLNALHARIIIFERDVLDNSHDLYKRRWPIAAICSSDARRIEDIGNKTTLIKLSSKTNEGLKQAFFDWESRIRHPSELEIKKCSKILCAKWNGGFLDGTAIHFNNNLNTLIGGKGTGKSTILESLRFAFGDEFKPQAEKAKEQHQEILKDVFRAGSQITVLVEAHSPAPKKYLIERIYNNPPVVKDDEGGLLPNIKPIDIVNIEAYGQKEIYEISRDPKFQLSLIDRFIGNSLERYITEEGEILRKLETNTQEYISFKKEINRLTEQIERLPALEEKQKRFNESGLPVRIADKSKYDEEKIWFENIELAFDDVLRHVGEIDLEITDPIPDEIDDYPSLDILQGTKKTLESVNSKIVSGLKGIIKILQDTKIDIFGDGKGKSEWQKAYELQTSEYEKIVSDLKKEFPDIDSNDYLENKKQIATLKPLKQKTATIKEAIDKILNERASLLQSMSENRRQQFEIRDKTCKKINESLDGILRVNVEYEGERHALAMSLS